MCQSLFANSLIYSHRRPLFPFFPLRIPLIIVQCAVLGCTTATDVIFILVDILGLEADTLQVEPQFAATITLHPVHFLASRLPNERTTTTLSIKKSSIWKTQRIKTFLHADYLETLVRSTLVLSLIRASAFTIRFPRHLRPFPLDILRSLLLNKKNKQID